jgi:integrase
MGARYRLSKTQVNAATKPGMHPDGGGLYLLVAKSGGKSWIYRYSRRGRQHEMGLGSYPTFSLDDARERANKHRQLLADGTDPLTAKRQEQQRLFSIRTFQDTATEFIAVKSHGWKNEKHAWQWGQTLKAHVYPRIGATPISDVGTEAVVSCIRPIWQKMPETAARVRSRIENILDYAAVKGYRPKGPNPAKWDGNIEHLLPSRGEMAKAGRVAGVKHMEALPYAEVPDFMAKLRARRGRTAQSQLTALAVEWTVMTAARSGETRGLTIEEIDAERQLWVIPPSRMKAHREHVVPLSDRVMMVWADILFGGPRDDHKIFPVSDTAMRRLACQIAGKRITLHGFRSSFRDWCAETGVRPDLAEDALAHVKGNKTEAAYNRTALVEQRREVMDHWTTFVYGNCDMRDTIEGNPIQPAAAEPVLQLHKSA